MLNCISKSYYGCTFFFAIILYNYVLKKNFNPLPVSALATTGRKERKGENKLDYVQLANLSDLPLMNLAWAGFKSMHTRDITTEE